MTISQAILNILEVVPEASLKYLSKVIVMQFPDIAHELYKLEPTLGNLVAAGKIEVASNEWRKYTYRKSK